MDTPPVNKYRDEREKFLPQLFLKEEKSEGI